MIKHIALADAQSITTLRAMAKNNAPGLIASLALDTANLYNAAASSAQAAPAAKPGSKALKYAQYKAAVFQAYALCFTGEPPGHIFAYFRNTDLLGLYTGKQGIRSILHALKLQSQSKSSSYTDVSLRLPLLITHAVPCIRLTVPALNLCNGSVEDLVTPSLAGLVRLKETQAGQAVRLLEESKFQVFGALPIAAAYNKAKPSTPAADHKEFDADLSICVDSALARVRWLMLQGL